MSGRSPHLSNTSSSPYVDNCYPSATASAPLPHTPAPNFPVDWPTPSSESRLIPYQPRPYYPYSHPPYQNTRPPERQEQQAHPQGLGLHIQNTTPRQSPRPVHPPHPPPPNPPSSTPSGPILSSPAVFKTPRSAAAASGLTSLFTPPLSAESFRTQAPQAPSRHMNSMDQQRRMSSQGQRPVMGPPETPSRGMIPQSPGLFSNVAFSPDLFAQQPMMDSQSAPVFPQQRLFWDASTATPMANTPQHFHTPSAFPDDFNASFNSTSTIMPQNFVTTPQALPYDLPTTSQPMDPSFMDGAVFPAPFQASPRMLPPQVENPTQFLSSPARRFGGDTQSDHVVHSRPMPDRPAYHHQIQESKREKQLLARARKSRTRKRSQDEDLVMKSVRRALSPKKNARPGLTRSATFAGVQSSARRSSTALDNVSLSSGASSRSTRAGRSSPIRRVRDPVRRSSTSSFSFSKPRASVSLAIDDHGVARTIMNALPEDDDEITDTEGTTEPTSSDDEYDQHMLYSFADDPPSSHESFLSRSDARDEIRSSVHVNVGSDRRAPAAKGAPPLDPRLTGHDPQSTIRRARGETLTSTSTHTHIDATQPSNAQQALRAIMQDRSRSASSHASSSSMQFHSSPPVAHTHLSGFNASPTTITDPDLATPSTDTGSHGSIGTTRCVCNSSSPDGNIMIQCDSCTKWLHAKCVGLTNRNIPDIYVCTFCEQTPIKGGTIRPSARQTAFHQSPLAHKSNRRR